MRKSSVAPSGQIYLDGPDPPVQAAGCPTLLDNRSSPVHNLTCRYLLLILLIVPLTTSYPIIGCLGRCDMAALSEASFNATVTRPVW
jgi:hypothetical protein